MIAILSARCDIASPTDEDDVFYRNGKWMLKLEHFMEPWEVGEQ